VKAGLPETKIWARHNPVYIESPVDEDAACEGISSKHKNILFVGTIVERKNIGFLLNAACFLRGNVNLLFAGPAEDPAYYQRLKLLAEDVNKKTNRRITSCFLGWVSDRKKLARLFTRSDLLWFASTQEGMGNVVIESLLYGTPVVTLPVCGIMENIIQSDDEGRVVSETATPDMFAAVVNEYLYDRKTDRNALQKKSILRFNPTDIERNYLTRFNNLVAT
jgi:glycosyltransferase involved in cell wall biosynthesis